MRWPGFFYNIGCAFPPACVFFSIAYRIESSLQSLSNGPSMTSTFIGDWSKQAALLRWSRFPTCCKRFSTNRVRFWDFRRNRRIFTFRLSRLCTPGNSTSRRISYAITPDGKSISIRRIYRPTVNPISRCRWGQGRQRIVIRLAARLSAVHRRGRSGIRRLFGVALYAR